MSEYDFELERVIKEIKKTKVRRVALQLPEGLKQHAIEIASKIEEQTNAVTVIYTDPSYGACDLKENQAEKLGVDLLIHFGHTEFKKRI